MQLPDQELHQRYYANGLTAYNYDVIVETIEQAGTLEAEYNALLEESVSLTEKWSWIGGMAYAPTNVQKLNAILSIQAPILCEGSTRHGGNQEIYPVEKWMKQLATYRNLIKKLQKAINDCQSSVEV